MDEVLIDSTFKTNRQKMELFTVIVSCMGVGFPIAYLLLEAGTGSGLKCREESLTFFLQHIRNKFPRLRPHFFFTDKEQAQIHSISRVFNIQPSLCLWHLKRAIKRKISEERRKETCRLEAMEESELLNLIAIHYFRSTVCLSGTDLELHKLALEEISVFFSGRNESEIHRYLLHNWYDDMNWKLWGRRDSTKVAITRTTMKVESHWSVLKRLFLLQFNRPRVDLLVHIIATRLLPKICNDYHALHLGLRKPFWWKSFVKTWKNCKMMPVHHSYTTNREMFTCSCPSWQRAQFFLCKHLVFGKECPKYRQVTINRKQPFLVIDEASTRVRANIDDEEFIGPPPLPEPVHDFTDVGTSNSIDLTMRTAEEDTEDKCGEEVEQVVVWLSKHILDLRSTNSGIPQLRFFHKRYLPRLRQYKSDIQESENAKQTPRTWANENITHLP